MAINQADFVAWKNTAVTQEIFKALKEQRQYINRSLTDATTIMTDDHLDRTLARLIGVRDGLDILLQISFEDMGENNEDSA